MIHINLLPPELRKRNAGLSPVFAGLAGGGFLCVILALIAWVVHLHVESAKTTLDEKIQELEVKTRKAEEVIKIEAEIEDHKKQRDSIVNLLAQKLLWAEIIDEFVTTLNGPINGQWSLPGYDVRCSELTISKSSDAGAGSRRAAGVSAGGQVVYSFSWRYRIYGKDMALSGDYIKSFFNSLAASQLWLGKKDKDKNNSFVGNPDDGFPGYSPKWNPSIERAVIENTLNWQRVKVIAAKPARGN